ncbi:ABC transporter ATP-binding protein [Oscillatoria sp. CS-180]|uniref:ABC transporter ATP-binding protein n=1 Tax=Oscillatoria sp. CS-180 TaxID=3021720 RepID=UPI00232D95B2|nr:ABC transporter ATP-binding protein [Oscillatoria sp. CS-180]MDB9529645.1 ABC transporter ATP-binding protein [Oscillatoria sp. CS-180]
MAKIGYGSGDRRDCSIWGRRVFAMEPIIQIENLSFTYANANQPVLSNIDLALNPGEIVLVAGATGSGKSTLLNCIAGIAPAHIGGALTGTIRCQGQDIETWTVCQRSFQIGTLLQNVETQIFTDTVTDEVVFGLENLNTPTQRIQPLTQAILQEFDLQAQKDWSIVRLSAGQKQRLIIACVLAMGQPALLLDEPFAYLDLKTSHRLLHLLKQRAAQGQAILIVEHRLDLIQSICDRALYIDQTHLHPRLPPKSPHLPISPAPNALRTSPCSPSPHPLLQTLTLTLHPYPPYPDLTLYPGQTVLLKGDNGSGKTTLLRMISGLVKPTVGSIELLECSIAGKRIVEIAQIVGFVLQNPNHQLFAETVQQEVRQPGISASTADGILAQLNLQERAEQHPQSLSQGQKRRLALGAVLARQPRLCLIDELTVGQDIQSLQLMLNLLRMFTQSGGTILLTSHDPAVAKALNAHIIEVGQKGS